MGNAQGALLNYSAAKWTAKARASNRASRIEGEGKRQEGSGEGPPVNGAAAWAARTAWEGPTNPNGCTAPPTMPPPPGPAVPGLRPHTNVYKTLEYGPNSTKK